MSRAAAGACAALALLWTGPSAAEEFTPDFVGDGLVEMLRAHGFTSAGRGGASAAGGGWTVRDIEASREGLAFSAGTVTLRGVADDEGERAWFRLDSLELQDVTLEWSDFVLEAGSFSVGDLRLLNLNEASSTGEDGYDKIDGAFSAMQFDSAELREWSLSWQGRGLARGDAQATGDGWWQSPSFPTAASLKVAGTVSPETFGTLLGVSLPDASEDQAFEAEASMSVNSSIRIASLSLSAEMGNLGGFASSAGFGGVTRSSLGEAVSWLQGGLETPPAALSLTRFVAASKGMGWAARLFGPDESATLAPPPFAEVIRQVAQALLSDGVTVVRAAPRNPVPLADALHGGTAPATAYGLEITR